MLTDVLIVENGRDRGEAIAALASAARLKVTLSRPYRGEALPDPQQAKVVILTGGPASVCNPEESSSRFLGPVLEFTRAAIERWTPLIGVCLGHQLIARALNGDVERLRRMEVGVRRIYPALAPRSQEAARDGGLQAFVFHQDHVPEPPPDCIVTFRSNGCAVEGFRHGERPIHGLQFHPEIAPQKARSILRWWYNENATTFGDLAGLTFDAEPAQKLLLNLMKQYTAKAADGAIAPFDSIGPAA